MEPASACSTIRGTNKHVSKLKKRFHRKYQQRGQLKYYVCKEKTKKPLDQSFTQSYLQLRTSTPTVRTRNITVVPSFSTGKACTLWASTFGQATHTMSSAVAAADQEQPPTQLASSVLSSPTPTSPTTYIKTTTHSYVLRGATLDSPKCVELKGRIVVHDGARLRGDRAPIRIGRYSWLDRNCLMEPPAHPQPPSGRVVQQEGDGRSLGAAT